MKKSALILICMVFVLTNVARGEESSQDLKDLIISPVAAPGFSPELGAFIGGGALLTFKTDPEDDLIQRSSVPILLGISSTGAWFLQSNISTYWTQDKGRMYVDLWFRDMPDNYWGVGYDAARNTVKSDSTTAYDRRWWQINPKLLIRVVPNLYAGLNYDLNRTIAENVSPGMANDPDFQEFGPVNTNIGLGGILQYDSRDIPVNTFKGILFDATATFYHTYFGSSTGYQVYDIQYRHTIPLQRYGRRLAWYLRTRFCEGDVPYPELSQLGTPSDLRGYAWGQYRDNTMLFGIVEYRHNFKGKGQNKFGEAMSRHGVVFWAGTGSIGEDFGDLENWLPNYGVGYRFELQPRMNLRIDFGWGKETSGIYLNFTEAF